LLALLVVSIAGVPWLKLATAMSWDKAFIVGMYPFIIGDILKIVAAAYCA
jgi:biotin transport system substrate-specific component